MKKFLYCLLFLFMIFSLASCSRDQEALSIYYPVNNELKSLDPQIASGDTEKTIAVNSFDGLVQFNQNGEIAPCAAESYEVSPDGLTYTFFLPKDRHWKISNSARKALEGKLPEVFDTRVSAHDFVFALRRAFDPETRCEDAILLSAIVNGEDILSGKLVPEHLGVKAISDFVLEVKLEYAQDSKQFLENLTLPLALPCNQVFFEACGGRYGLSLNHIISNGPFYLSRWREEYSLRLIKYEEYAGPRVSAAEGLYFYVNNDSDDIISKLEKETYNTAYLSSEEFSKLKKAEEYGRASFENISYSFCFNLESEAFSSKSLRRAIAHSINLDMLSDFWPKEDALVSQVDFDENLAQAELRTALDELEKSSLELSLLCDEEHEQMLRLQMQEWQRILGVEINIRLSVLPLEELEKTVKTGTYDLAFYPLSKPGFRDYDFYRIFLSESSFNVVNMDDEAYNDLFNDYLKNVSQNEADQKKAELENHLVEQTVFLPVYKKESHLVTNKKISGVQMYSSPDIVYFTYSKYRENN